MLCCQEFPQDLGSAGAECLEHEENQEAGQKHGAEFSKLGQDSQPLLLVLALLRKAERSTSA